MAVEYLLKTLSTTSSKKIDLLFENTTGTQHTSVVPLNGDVSNYKILYFEWFDGSNVGHIITEIAVVDHVLNTSAQVILCQKYAKDGRYCNFTVQNTKLTIVGVNAGHIIRVYGIA